MKHLARMTDHDALALNKRIEEAFGKDYSMLFSYPETPLYWGQAKQVDYIEVLNKDLFIEVISNSSGYEVISIDSEGTTTKSYFDNWNSVCFDIGMKLAIEKATKK